jgi:prevent-host-death family protein
MKSVSANEAKQSLGHVLDTAQREPVLIQKHKRPTAVILSVAEYDRLRGLNANEFTSFCDTIGARAEKRGLTESLLSDLLDES